MFIGNIMAFISARADCVISNEMFYIFPEFVPIKSET